MSSQGSPSQGYSKHTFVVYVEDKPGVLNRVASLFRRRAFNIDSLSVGPTEQPGVSRMTIVVEADETIARRVEANLYKLVNVLCVEDVTFRPSVTRDLALIKVRADPEARAHILQLCEVFRAKALDVTPKAIEMARTGRVAMTRGPQAATVNPEFVSALVPNGAGG